MEKTGKEQARQKNLSLALFFFSFEVSKNLNADYSNRKHREASHHRSLDGLPIVEKQKASYRAKSARSKTQREVHRRELQPNRPGEPKFQTTRKMPHSF